MSISLTQTVSESFTLTHARYLASKVTTDMLRLQQIYGRPTNTEINDYGTELALLLRDGYVEDYEFGFKIGDQRLLSLKYIVIGSDLTATNDRPGRVPAGIQVGTAKWFTFLTYSDAWSRLSTGEQAKIEETLPIKRSTGTSPKDGLGYWSNDLSYSAGGVSLSRGVFRPYSS
jgi:Bacterial HORMA domain family 1